jgi:hypothetical protein
LDDVVELQTERRARIQAESSVGEEDVQGGIGDEGLATEGFDTARGEAGDLT